jgi:hypothetical protein
MESALAVAMRRLLNDRAVFNFRYDRESGRSIELFGGAQWDSLRTSYKQKDLETVRKQVESRKRELEGESKQSGRTGRKRGGDPFQANIQLADGLLTALHKSSGSLEILFDMFDSFGSLETRLPSMEDYGKVAEFEPEAILRLYFLTKISRANQWQKIALKRVLEEVEYLLGQGTEPTHVGFFLRKLDSLKLLPEVITNV